jgi:hypothetical protein
MGNTPIIMVLWVAIIITQGVLKGPRIFESLLYVILYFIKIFSCRSLGVILPFVAYFPYLKEIKVGL